MPSKLRAFYFLIFKYNRDMDKSKLTSIQHAVTQESATEPPFQNEYWNHFEEGLYVDIVSGEVLFSSLDKFNSSCGWPSFDKILVEDNITEHSDFDIGYLRVEVKSKKAKSHLGHVFTDGPTETGVRYCINSASLRFISKDELEERGYGDYVDLFKRA